MGRIYTVHVKQQQATLVLSRHGTACNGLRTMPTCYVNHSFSSHYQVFWVSLDLRVCFRIWCASNNGIQI
jgi:hypothetical protein